MQPLLVSVCERLAKEFIASVEAPQGCVASRFLYFMLILPSQLLVNDLAVHREEETRVSLVEFLELSLLCRSLHT